MDNLKEYWKTSSCFYKKMGLDPSKDMKPLGDNALILNIASISKKFEAYEGIIHGGYVSTLLDSVGGITALFFADKKFGKIALTSSMKVEFKRPLSPLVESKVIGSVSALTENGCLGEAKIYQKDNVVAQAIFSFRFKKP
mgnify:FL=1